MFPDETAVKDIPPKRGLRDDDYTINDTIDTAASVQPI
jgi:hypothetical protein